MFTTMSTSGNSKRCGTSASRSFGPMSGSSSISWKTRSMTVAELLRGRELQVSCSRTSEGFDGRRLRGRTATASCRDLAAVDREVDARLAAGFGAAVDAGAGRLRGRRLRGRLGAAGAGLGDRRARGRGAGAAGGRLARGGPGLARGDERAGLAGGGAPVAADVAPAAGVSAADSERCEAPRTSRSATRRASSSTSRRRPLRSSSTRDSSNSSRTFAAAAVTSWTSSCARPRPACAPSAVAWKVRSTALRTASTVSGAPFLSFFLLFFSLSFFAIAAQV